MPNEVLLSEANRAKLDGIVSKMIANKESDDNIKFVVEDFKKKYSEAPKKKKSPSKGSQFYSKALEEVGLSAIDRPEKQKASVSSGSTTIDRKQAAIDKAKASYPDLYTKTKVAQVDKEKAKVIAEISRLENEIRDEKQLNLKKDIDEMMINSEMTDAEMAKVFRWSEEDVRKAKAGTPSKKVPYAPAMAKPKDAEQIIKDVKKAEVYKGIWKDQQNKKNQIFDTIDNNIDSDFISNTEEYVVENLRNKFSGSGFIFEESGMGSYLTVKFTPDGLTTSKEIEIPLNYGDRTGLNDINAKKLKDFMKGAYMTKSEWQKFSPTSSEVKGDKYENGETDWMLRASELMSKNPMKYGEELINKEQQSNVLNKYSRSISQEYKWLESDYANLKKQIDAYNQNPTDEERISINNRMHELSVKEYNLNNKAKKLSDIDKNFSKATAAYTLEKSKKGTFLGQLGAQFASGFGSLGKASANIGIELMSDFIPAEDMVDPITYSELKDSGMSDDQISDYAAKELKRTIMPALEDAYYRIGSAGSTTKEYIQSEDRGTIENVLGSLAESLGTALSGGSNPMQRLAFFAQSYNSMSEQMRGKEFDGMSESDKMLVAVPFGLAVGALEKFGYNASMGLGKSGIFNKTVNTVIRKSLTDLPKDATIGEIKREINKNVSNLVKSGAIKIVAGSITEGNVEGIQNLTETGTKFLVNEIYDKELFQNVPDITTRDGIMEAVSMASEDAALGALGGLIMSGGSISTQTYKQAKFNETSDYNFDLFYGTLMDENLRSSLKYNTNIKLKNGEITESEAKEELESIDRNTGILRSIPAELSLRDKKDSFNLISERNKLEQEIDGKDAALIVKQKARISEINSELNKISENATKENNVEQQEDTTEGSKVEYQGAVKGQQEVGTTEGSVGQTTQQKTDTGDSTVESRSVKELGTKATQEVNTYIAELGSNERIGGTVDSVMAKMNNAEYINDSEINSTIDTIFSEVESINNDANYSDETKKALSDKLMNIAEQLDNYEFRTKTETIAVTQRGTAPVAGQAPTTKISAEKFFEGQTAEVNGVPATFKSNKGRTEAVMDNGETVVLDTPTMKINEGDFEFDDAGALMAVTVTDRFGTTAKFTGDIAMDLAIKQRENEIGTVEQADFDTVYKEVETKYVKETSKSKEAVNSEKVKTLRAQEQQELNEAIPNIEEYRVDGEINKESMPADVLAKYNEIYDKYDAKITPLLPATKTATTTKVEQATPTVAKQEVVTEVKPAAKTVEQEVEELSALIEGQPKFQKGTEGTVDETQIDSITEEMNSMPEDIANFDVPSDLTTKNKTNINSLIKRFGDKLKLVFKGGVIKDISDYNGIPMIFTISDQLTSGNIKNQFTGNTIDLNGGIGFNLTEGNENNAWANTAKEEAEGMLSRAQDVYSKNKDLFDRLWAEGKLPKGQIPMAIVKMGQDSIKSNEALFRFASDTIKKKFSKSERVNSLNGLIEDISAVNTDSKVISFIKENNFKTIDELLDNMNTLKPIGERAIVTNFLFTGSIKLDTETKPTATPKSKAALALVGDKDKSYYKYIHLQTINNAIQDESTKSIPSSHIIGITGVDVLNPGITQPKHRNYPYGVRGGLIGILESPVHAADIFPEMYSKSFYLNKENKKGKFPSVNQAVDQSVAASGPVASIKAFRGAKISTKMTEVQKLLGKLKLAFPTVTIVDTQEEFDKSLESDEVKKFVKDGEVVYGFTKDGKIFLNPKKANSNTAIHEYSHIWMGFLEENNPKLLAKAYNLLEGTEVLKRKIAEFGDVKLAREEALAELIANKGETLIEAGKKSKFKNWLNAVFSYVKSNFKAFDKLTPEEFQNISLNDFVDGSLASLLGGKEITSKEIKKAKVLFSKGKYKEASDVVKIARDNGFSDAATRQYLLNKGFSVEQIDGALAPYIAKDNAITEFNKEYNKLIDKGETEANAFDEAMYNVVFNLDNDALIEEVSNELMKSYGKKTKPSAYKPKSVTIISNNAKGLADLIRIESKAVREKKKQIKEVLASISSQVKDMVTKGSISVRQMSAIVNALKNTNLESRIMVDRFVDYVSKVVSNADYIERVNKGLNFKKAIKRNLNKRANPFVSVAKSFTELNPKWVVDINKYNEVAELVFNSVKPTRITKDAVNFKQEADIEVIAKYIAEEQENHLKIHEANVRDRYERITEEKSEGKTIEEMNNILLNLKDKKDYSSQIAAELKEKLAEYKKMVTNDDLAEVKAAVNVDLNLIDTKMAISILDALDTYFANGSNASLKAIMATYGGIVAVNEFNGKAKALRMLGSKKIGRVQNEQFTNINMLSKRLFRGQNAGQAFLEAIGFNNLVQGSNRAERQSVDKQNEYTKRFKNVKNFNTAENIFERNVIAWLRRRDVNANEQDSFNKRLKLLKDSVDVLRKSGTATEIAKADVYEKVFKKLGLYDDNVSIENVLGKSEKFNIDAVDFVTEMWSDIYPQLSDTSLGVYNTMLANDINYTPDKFTNLDSSIPSEFDVESSGFMSFNSNYTLDKNSAGVLMETTRPSKLPANMYIDLDFDRNMFRSYKLALNDMYTAEAIRHTNAFLKSDKFSEIIPTAEDRRIVASAIQGYVSAKKGKNYIERSEMNFFNSFLDALGGFGAARALAGFSQFANQWATANVFTLINAGEYMRPLDFRNKDVLSMIANSGLPISNVGIEALTTIENADKELEKAGIVATVGGAVDKYTLRYLKKSNAFLLKQLLANPDRFARVQAFAAYYRKSMAQQGLKADFKAPMNEKAAKYAQSMVDANMDVSDTEMRGQFFKSKNAYVKIIKQVFFPFSTFSMNQRNRVWSDAAVVVNPANKQERITALRSLAAFSAEFFTYNAIRYGAGLLIIRGAVAALGLDDEEEEKIIKKYEENLMKSIKSSSITDVLSPTPVLDEATLSVMNKMMPMFGIGTPTEEEFQKYIDGINEERIYKGKEKLTEDEVAIKRNKYMLDEQFQFYIDNEKSTGMLGIQFSKIQELYDIVDAYYTGKYSRERFAGGGYEEVSLSDDAKESLKYIALLKLEGTLLGPRETDQIANRMFKIVKDTKTLTEAQKAKYDVIKKDYKIDAYKLSLIKTTMKTENVLKEIEYIESTGGLTEKQSKEYAKLRAFGEIDGWGLDDIRKGKTAKQIIASRQ